MEGRLWEPVWRSPKKRQTEVPCDPAFPLLGAYRNELKTGFRRDICTPVFATAKPWKRHKSPLMDRRADSREAPPLAPRITGRPPALRTAAQPEVGGRPSRCGVVDVETMLLRQASHKRTSSVRADYMRYLEIQKSQRQKVEWRPPGAGRAMAGTVCLVRGKVLGVQGGDCAEATELCP